MKPIRIHPLALAEVREAAGFYTDRAVNLGRAFLRSYDNSVGRLQRFPEANAYLEAPYRGCAIPRFPYNIVYRVETDALFIIAVAHYKRKPAYWKHRG